MKIDLAARNPRDCDEDCLIYSTRGGQKKVVSLSIPGKLIVDAGWENERHFAILWDPEIWEFEIFPRDPNEAPAFQLSRFKEAAEKTKYIRRYLVFAQGRLQFPSNKQVIKPSFLRFKDGHLVFNVVKDRFTDPEKEE